MKKIVSLILVLILLLGLFVSCKEKGNGEASSLSSEISYLDASSSIAKTEGDGNFTFAFDPYVLSEDVKKVIGGTLYYNKFVDTVMDRKQSLEVPSREVYDNIRFAIGENFPFSVLIETLRFDTENNEILITYNYEKTHEQKISDFKQEVEKLFNECVNNNDDTVLAAMSVYKYLATNIEIVENKFIVENITEDKDSVSSSISADEESTFENVKTDIYTTLIDKKGTDEAVSALYSFLMLQLGVDSKSVSAWESNKNYKTWNLIKLNSKWYHCDIVNEQKKTEGEGLKFFGMTESRVSEQIPSGKFYIGEWSWFTNELPKASSNRFKDFSSVQSWEISETRDEIEAYTDEFSRFTWEIK